MKVYFTLSYRAAEKFGAEAREIVKWLKDNKHSVDFRVYPIHDDALREKDKAISDLIDFRKVKDVSDIYKTTLKKIRDADVIITETSVPSNSVGYEIALAQSERKPVLLLRNKNADTSMATLLSGNTSKLMRVASYSEPKDVGPGIRDFMDFARQNVDTKFILIISPEIDRYLSWASEERRLHKAQIVRNALEDMMEKDKEYRKYMQDTSMNS